MKTEGFYSTLAIRDNQKGALCIVYDNKGREGDVPEYNGDFVTHS